MNGFDSIIGYRGIKETLMQISDLLKNRDVYAQLGVDVPRGILLHGEPGVGKTMMAQALIAESGLKSFICRKDEADGKFVASIKKVFDSARAESPCIILLDDLDKFSNEDEYRRNTDEFVTVQSCIDSLKGSGVFVVATANDISCLPDSLIRVGRFDRVIEVPLPSEKDALEIIRHYLKGKQTAEDLDPEFVSRIMHDRSCAELEEILNKAGLLAGYERKGKMNTDHFIRAYLNQDENDEYDSDSDAFDFAGGNPDSLQSHIIYHEAGHAVVSEILSPNSVTVVSALKEDQHRGGFVSYAAVKNAVPVKSEKIKAIAALGGKAAIEYHFGVPDCGAVTDINNAHRILYHHVCDACTLGFSHYEKSSRSDSEVNKAVINAELENCYRKAQEIIARNSEFLFKLASELSKHGYLTYKDIQQVKSRCLITPFSV